MSEQSIHLLNEQIARAEKAEARLTKAEAALREARRTGSEALRTVLPFLSDSQAVVVREALATLEQAAARET